MQFSAIELWQEMGFLAKSVVVLLLGMSLLSFSTAVEQWLFLSRTTRESARFLRAWRERMVTQGYAAAAVIAAQYPRCVIAQVVTIGTRIFLSAPDASQRSEVYDRAMRREIVTAGSTIRRGLGLLATVGSTAPFVGLFGTVIGIVNAFQSMAASGQGGLGVVSRGIAEALVTTALGIGVAIPAVWLFNFLTQRIARFLNEMECVAEELAVVALGNAQRDAESLVVPTRKEGSDGNATWR
ncbi:MAG: tolQ protein [Deltaproteobacteria bacterium]|nr:tolQ protein [Deltaproteobacteria bacterium]